MLLPHVPDHASAESQSLDSAAEPGAVSVLVVDDEEALRELMSILLESLGYQSVTAATRAEALAIVHSEAGQSLDLLITDLSMTDVDGGALATEIAQILPSLKIIYTSGYPSEDPTVAGLDLTDAVFLPKPICPQSLANAIDSVFAEPASRRAASSSERAFRSAAA